MLRALCFATFCVLAAVNTNADPDLKISFATLKSDLDLIMDDFSSPRTINIQYTDDAVLKLLVVPNLRGLGGRFIRIDGTVEIKQRQKPIQKMKDMEYKDGSFGLHPDAEDNTYIIIRENPMVEIQEADKTLRYISKEQLTDLLTRQVKDIQTTQTSTGNSFEWREFGTPGIDYSITNDYFILDKPLKGISVRKNEIRLDKNFFREKKERLSTPGGLLDMKTFSLHASKKKPDVFFDVWFEPKSKKFGSSRGSFDGFEAFRIYDEWDNDILLASTTAMESEPVASRANDIRERTFREDIHNAYMHLRNTDQTYKNALLNYDDEIVLECHAIGDGDDRHVWAAGTTQADATGNGPQNVKAFYDLQELEYSDKDKSDERFEPKGYERKTWNLKYTDWNKFENHLSAIWAAMQGGCARSKKLTYDFSIFYGKSIGVKYHCKTESFELADTIMVVTDDPKFQKPTITRITDIQYLSTEKTIKPPTTTGIRPTAIREEPADLWVKYNEPEAINADALKVDLELLKDTLIKNGKSKKSSPIQGAILLDNKVLIEMTLPHQDAGYRYTEVYANFMPSLTPFETKLNFPGGGFSKNLGDIVPFNDVLISTAYKDFDRQMANSHVVRSKYITIKELQKYLGRISEEATIRCVSIKQKYFYFQLAQHGRFALQGFYHCSEEAFLVHGTFRALLLTNTLSETQIQTARLVNHFIYLNKDEFFIPDTGSFRDVFAISVPEVTDLEATWKSFGAPILVDSDTVIRFKSEAF